MSPLPIIVNADCVIAVVKYVHGINATHMYIWYVLSPPANNAPNIIEYTANCNNGFKNDHITPKIEFLYLPLISFFTFVFNNSL